MAKLASSEDNKDILIELLSKDVYKRLIETLYLPDISVSVATFTKIYPKFARSEMILKSQGTI